MVILPNGSSWDNEIPFRENEIAAQFWFFETLRLALEKDPSVEMLGINTDVKYSCYSKLKRDGIYLTIDDGDFYYYKDWENYTLGVEIDYSLFFNTDNWVFSKDIKFKTFNV